MVIDTHAHVGVSWLGWKNPFNKLEKFLQMYSRYNIDRVCISSWLMVYDAPTANKEVFRAIKRYPEHLIGFAGISPQCGEVAVQNEIDRCVGEYGMKGIKINSSEGRYSVDCFFLEPVLTRAIKYNIPILMHSSDDSFSNPDSIANVAEKFPDAKIIIAHMGGEQWMRAVSIAKTTANVYLDTAGSCPDQWVIPIAVHNCGEDKILWGSDFPSLNLASELAKVTESRLAPRQKGKILYENAKTLLNL